MQHIWERVTGQVFVHAAAPSELDVGNREKAAAAELNGEAEEDLAVAGDAAESLGEQRDGVDAVLIAESEAGDGVADGPGGVGLEADHLVRALHHRLPDPLQSFVVGELG